MVRFYRWTGSDCGNPKAILFYIGVLPGFVDLAHVTIADMLVVAAMSSAIPLVLNTGFGAAVGAARTRLATPERLVRLRVRLEGLWQWSREHMSVEFMLLDSAVRDIVMRLTALDDDSKNNRSFQTLLSALNRENLLEQKRNRFRTRS